MTKIWGLRSSLIGDTVISLPILNILKRQINDPYVIFSILRKCSQAAPLYFNHPLIDRIKISDNIDSYGDEDQRLIDQCKIVFDCSPNRLNALEDKYIQQIIDSGVKDLSELDLTGSQEKQELKLAIAKESFWYNYYNAIEQTVRMARVDLQLYHNLPDDEKFPKLYRWWDRKKYGDKKHIALWPLASYGGGNFTRNPSIEQWKDIIDILVRKGYYIHHFGWYEEPILGSASYVNHTQDSFIEQIKSSLDCNFILGIESGSTWALAAYGEIPQLNLLCMSNHIEHQHRLNPLAHEPKGSKSFSYVTEDHWGNLNIDKVIEQVELIQ